VFDFELTEVPSCATKKLMVDPINITVKINFFINCLFFLGRKTFTIKYYILIEMNVMLNKAN
jgi:hypothetical protein